MSARELLSPFDEVTDWVDAQIEYLEMVATEYWGERCPDFESECATCQVWAAIEQFRLWNTRAPAQKGRDDDRT